MTTLLPLVDLQVLIVDSDPDSQTILKMLFDIYGVKTICVSSVNQALKSLRTNLPNLIISELQLADDDAYSLMHHIEIFELTWKVKIPAIALSIYDNPSDRQRALASGFSEFISKPFDLDHLIATVARVVQQERLTSLVHRQTLN